MHPQLEQQIRLCVRDGSFNPDMLVKLVDTGYRESDSRMHMLIDRLQDSVLVLDEQLGVLEANPAARQLLKIAQGPLEKLTLSDFVPDLRLDESMQHAQGAILASKEGITCQDKSGQAFMVRLDMFVLHVGETGKRICVLRRLDGAKFCPNDPGDCTTATSAAQEKYLAMMSHELRTPMNAVLGMAKHLLASGLSEEQNESVKTIIDAGDVMMSLLNDLLDKSKIDANKLSLERVSVDLRHTLHKMERLWRPSIEEKGLTFALLVSDQVPAAIKGDSVRIRQILSNLLSNSAKFTETGSVTLEVDAEPVGSDRIRVEFAVRDTGIGMSAEVLSRLFSDYEQASDSTGRQFGGTGLGLSISRRLAHLMGGDIKVQSKPGIGSVFRFYAEFDKVEGSSEGFGDKQQPAPQPAESEVPPQEAVAPPKEPASAPPAMTAPSAKAPDDDSLRILAVEDNPINQRVLAAFLRPIGGDVVWAGDGREALDILEKEHFDVVLMDIQMPVMDGLEATKSLRASDSRNKSVPIVAMTANAMLGDRETCLSAGMNEYISKPIDPKRLYKTIAHVVDVARGVASAAEGAAASGK